MVLTEDNVMKVLEDLIPYIEAYGGWLEFVEIEEELNMIASMRIKLKLLRNILKSNHT